MYWDITEMKEHNDIQINCTNKNKNHEFQKQLNRYIFILS
jgi:hypothetical protein